MESISSTMLVPYSMACSVWKVPFFPVMPWQITRVVLSTNTAGEGEGAAVKWRMLWRRDAMEAINFVTAWRPIRFRCECEFHAAWLLLLIAQRCKTIVYTSLFFGTDRFFKQHKNK